MLENPPSLHPFERFPNATRRVTLPLSGFEVVVRKIDIDAVTAGGLRYALSLPALERVATLWANEAAKESEQDGQRRPQPTMEPEEKRALEHAVEVAVLRNALLAPTLDDLLLEYGGSEGLDDLGLGPDYGVLLRVVAALNPAEAGGGADAARTFLAP